MTESEIIEALERAVIKGLKCEPWRFWRRDRVAIIARVRETSMIKRLIVSNTGFWAQRCEKDAADAIAKEKAQAKALKAARKRERSGALHRWKRWVATTVLGQKPQSALVEKALEDAARRSGGKSV